MLSNVRGFGVADPREGAKVIAISRLRRPFSCERFLFVTMKLLLWRRHLGAPWIGRKGRGVEVVRHGGIRRGERGGAGTPLRTAPRHVPPPCELHARN